MRQDRLPSIRHVKFPKGYRGWDEGYIHVGPEDGRRYHVTSLRLITSNAALYPHRHDWHCDLRVGMTTFRTKRYTESPPCRPPPLLPCCPLSLCMRAYVYIATPRLRGEGWVGKKHDMKDVS